MQRKDSTDIQLSSEKRSFAKLCTDIVDIHLCVPENDSFLSANLKKQKPIQTNSPISENDSAKTNDKNSQKPKQSNDQEAKGPVVKSCKLSNVDPL